MTERAEKRCRTCTLASQVHSVIDTGRRISEHLEFGLLSDPTRTFEAKLNQILPRSENEDRRSYRLG